VPIRPNLYLMIRNRWGTVPWFQTQPGWMLQCIHITCETLQSINTTTRHYKVSKPPQDTAKYQHHHKTLHSINTTTRHCIVSTPPQDTAKYQHHHKTLQIINTICETLQSMHTTSETLQYIKTTYGTLQSIPITLNADMGTHVEELGKQSNEKWQLTVEHSAVHLAITTLQCGYCKIMWLSLVSEIGRITRRHQCRHCATKMYGTGCITSHVLNFSYATA